MKTNLQDVQNNINYSNMIEPNSLHLGDCLDIMKDIPDNSIDCIICDLPYGTTDCAWDSVIPMQPLWEQYKRILKHQGSVLLFGSEPFSTMLRMSNLDWYKYDWIWEKSSSAGFVHAKNMPMKRHEVISVFSGASMGHESLLGENRMTYNPQGLIPCHKVSVNAKGKFGGVVGTRPSHKDVVVSEWTNYPSSILKFDNDGDGWHPTQKPVDLLRYLILTYSNQNDIILDNCMGSGTTCVAAIKEKRRYIGIEKEEKYFRIANKRIEQEKMQLNLF